MVKCGKLPHFDVKIPENGLWRGTQRQRVSNPRKTGIKEFLVKQGEHILLFYYAGEKRVYG
jgi:hypothetical protein